MEANFVQSDWNGKETHRLNSVEEVMQALACMAEQTECMRFQTMPNTENLELIEHVMRQFPQRRSEILIPLCRGTAKQTDLFNLQTLFPVLLSGQSCRILCRYIWCDDSASCRDHAMLVLSDTEILLVSHDGKSGIWIRSDLFRTYFERLYDKQKKQSVLYAECYGGISEHKKECSDEDTKHLHLKLDGNRESGERIRICLSGKKICSVSIGEIHLVKLFKQYLSGEEDLSRFA